MTNVLYLDDDTMVLQTFKSLFGKDYKVFTANDPFDAYNIMKTENIHIVISDLEMPATSNVLQYFTEDGTKISVRPSGTEPKIKFYVEVRGEMKSRSDYDASDAAANKKIDAVRASLGV